MEYSHRYADSIRASTGPYSPYEQRSTSAYSRALELGLAAAGITLEHLQAIENGSATTPEASELPVETESDKPAMVIIGQVATGAQSQLQAA